MKVSAQLASLLLLALSPVCRGQAAPAASAGPTFDYTLRYSESARFGEGSGAWHTITPSLDANYANGDDRRPFLTHYSLAYTATPAGPSYATGFAHRLSLEQSFMARHWGATLSDDVSFRPGEGGTGFLGIFGSGAPVSDPNPPGGSILTLRGHVLNNHSQAGLSLGITARNTVNLGVDSTLLRYPDGEGLDTNTLEESAQFSRRINSRNTLSGAYAHAQFSYPDYTFYRIHTDSVTALYERLWTRALRTRFSGGPQFMGSSVSLLLPSTVTWIGSAQMAYQILNGDVHLSGTRATSGGSGYFKGQILNAISAGYSHGIGRDFTSELSASYNQTSSLGIRSASFDSFVGAVQLSKQVSRHVSIFLTYSAMCQQSSTATSNSVLNGTIHAISFGTRYSPRPFHRRQ